MLWLFSSGDQAARGAAKRGRNERGEAVDGGGREFSRRGANMGALRRGVARVGAASGDRRAHKLFFVTATKMIPKGSFSFIMTRFRRWLAAKAINLRPAPPPPFLAWPSSPVLTRRGGEATASLLSHVAQVPCSASETGQVVSGRRATSPQSSPHRQLSPSPSLPPPARTPGGSRRRTIGMAYGPALHRRYVRPVGIDLHPMIVSDEEEWNIGPPTAALPWISEAMIVWSPLRPRPHHQLSKRSAGETLPQL